MHSTVHHSRDSLPTSPRLTSITRSDPTKELNVQYSRILKRQYLSYLAKLAIPITHQEIATPRAADSRQPIARLRNTKFKSQVIPRHLSLTRPFTMHFCWRVNTAGSGSDAGAAFYFVIFEVFLYESSRFACPAEVNKLFPGQKPQFDPQPLGVRCTASVAVEVPCKASAEIALATMSM
ncbi:unnamed protein product [Rhizoctonia solani]|uniref:Uncharacterized protein n=1 Tax=Rhizoctonia solani TaxID=456999 RepID=A0A8H3C2M6_9AGAM|nr:unnamed protein product [Rhizoctonia solani]